MVKNSKAKKTARFSIVVPRKVVVSLRKHASENGFTVAHLTRHILTAWVSKGNS